MEPGTTQTREERVRLLSDALAALDRPSTVLSLLLAPRCAIARFRIRADRLSGGVLRVEVAVMPRPTDGVPVDLSRLVDVGWPIGETETGRRVPMRTWTVDRTDASAVEGMVDAVAEALAASPVPPDLTWSIATLPEAEGVTRPGAPPPDERWVQDAMEPDLRERLVRLASMRGGRIAVRRTGRSTVIGLAARRRRGAIEVKATDLGAPELSPSAWTAHWRYGGERASAMTILREVDDALCRLSPQGKAGVLELRLEVHDASTRYEGGYAFFAGSIVAAVGVGVVALVAGSPDAPGLLGVVGRLRASFLELEPGPEGVIVGVVVLLLLWMTGIVWATVASEGVARVDRRLAWSYTTSDLLEVVAGFLGCTSFLVLAFAAGNGWWLLALATWIAATVWLVGTLVRDRRHDGEGGAARPT